MATTRSSTYSTRSDRVIDRERLVGAFDEVDAEARHRDVLGTRELPAHAARRAQRRCEFVRAVAFDDDDAGLRRKTLDEIRDGRAHDRAADDCNVVSGLGQVGYLVRFCAPPST